MSALLEVLRAEAARAGGRIARKAAAIVAAAVLGLASLGFAVACFHLWLLTQLDPIPAAATTAAVLAMLGGLCLALARRGHRPPPRLSTDGGQPPGSPRLSPQTVLQLASSALLVGIALGRRLSRK